MLVAYLDESGIAQHETAAVVAAVLAPAERVIIIEGELDRLVSNYFGPGVEPGFRLHATDIWSHAGVYNDRAIWPPSRRASLMHDFASLLKALDVRIVYHLVRKSDFHFEEPGVRQRDYDVAGHSLAFLGCLIHIERAIQDFCPDQHVDVIAEDSPAARAEIMKMDSYIRDEARIARDGVESAGVLPLRHVGIPRFLSKQECKPLQLADLAAFFIRRFHMGRNSPDLRFRHHFSGLVLPWRYSPEGQFPFGPLRIPGQFLPA